MPLPYKVYLVRYTVNSWKHCTAGVLEVARASRPLWRERPAPATVRGRMPISAKLRRNPRAEEALPSCGQQSASLTLTSSFPEGDLNEAATAADASRGTIWQGNCEVGHQQLCNKIAPIRNTIPIQYPIGNCPPKKGFLQVAVSKARRAAVSPTPPPDFRRRASDTALRLRRSKGLHSFGWAV